MEFFRILLSKWKIARLQKSMDRTRAKLGDKNIEIEKIIHSFKPADKREKFVTSFVNWFESQKNLDVSIAELLGNYIDEFKLLKPNASDEPSELTDAATRLRILIASRNDFDDASQEILDRYIRSLQIIQSWEQTKWDVYKKTGFPPKHK